MSPTTMTRRVRLTSLIVERNGGAAASTPPRNRSERNSSSVTPTVIRSPARSGTGWALAMRTPFSRVPLVLRSTTEASSRSASSRISR